MTNLHDKLYRKSGLYAFIVNILMRIVLPGFGGVPLYYVFRFFIRRMLNEIITVRASSIAFSFFLALIPALIFLFSLIPYVPVQDLSHQIFALLKEFMPSNAFNTIKDTLQDILVNKRGGLLSAGFLMTLYFATNGLYNMMEAFNKEDSRPFWTRRLISFNLLICLSVLVVLGMILLVGGESVLKIILRWEVMENVSNAFFIVLFQFGGTFVLLYLANAILYYWGSKKETRVQFFSPGAFISALFCLFISYGFAFYVDNFSQYNKLFGSLGTLIALMVWLYLNAMVLIIGYEFNRSIAMAKKVMYDEDQT